MNYILELLSFDFYFIKWKKNIRTNNLRPRRVITKRVYDVRMMFKIDVELKMVN